MRSNAGGGNQHLEMEIQTLTGEIESGRTAVQEMPSPSGTVDDANLLEAERTMDQFRSYTPSSCKAGAGQPAA